ncbi:hypothetical protein SNEBB_001031 [Seison nebaliae]|nr:hypothetical protein SNEBB_001031 [Seison nebaliae]
MFKLDLPTDAIEAAKIQRMRNNEAERQNRIFNSKNRIIGIDKNDLDHQVKEKQFNQQTQQMRNDAYANMMKMNDKIAVEVETDLEMQRKEYEKQLNNFRSIHQKPEQRREWDLYDPDRLKKELPPRISDDDPRCGISSIQKLTGEDLDYEERKKLQQEQMKRWTNEQLRQKQERQSYDNQAKRLYELQQKDLNYRATELDRTNIECQKAINVATAEFNRLLNDEQKNEQERKRRQEEMDKATEISNNINSDILTENPDMAMSAFGPHRVVPYQWKGMSETQFKQLKEDQLRQAEDDKRRKEEEKRNNENWVNVMNQHAKIGMVEDEKMRNMKREDERQLLLANQKLAEEQKLHQNHLEKNVYTNQATPAYFMQFNKCSR